ncbi:MAG: YbaB/EbfC family nucleoid-associated protein [Cyanobacteria bacterium P01_F01_bin.143]
MAPNPFGKMKELANAFQKAQEVQQGAQALQAELEQLVIEGSSSNGLVKVFMSGNQEPKNVEISDAAIAEGATKVSAMVSEAMTDAYTKSTETMRVRMEELTSGLNLPGLGM